MKIGTKSLLFGVHQFLWHPWTVAKAWRKLYGKWPTWEQALCILVHDWGYWGKPNMDGPEGKTHPEAGARLAAWIISRLALLRGASIVDAFFLSYEVYKFTVCHSSAAAKKLGQKPSALYYADKASVLEESEGFYLLRAKASGEVWEYIKVALDSKVWPDSRRWFFCECLTRDEQAKVWLRWYREKTKNRVNRIEVI